MNNYRKIKYFTNIFFILFLAVYTVKIYSRESSMEYMLPLNKNWLIQSCQNAPEAGSLISTTKYFPVNWHRAVVPSTVMGALVNDGSI